MLAREMNTNSVTPVESHFHFMSSRTVARNEVDRIEFDFARTESVEVSLSVFVLRQQQAPLCSLNVTLVSRLCTGKKTAAPFKRVI